MKPKTGTREILSKSSFRFSVESSSSSTRQSITLNRPAASVEMIIILAFSG